MPEVYKALDMVAKAAGARSEIEIPEARRARAAAYVITATEGATLHLERLRNQGDEFDPAVRDRLIAGAMIPSAMVNKAQIFRRWFRQQMLELFKSYDAILAPATPVTAPKLGQTTFLLGRRRNAGAAEHGHLHATDLVHRPAGRRGAGALEADAVGIQIIAAPWREDVALRIAHALEQQGVVAARRPEIAGGP